MGDLEVGPGKLGEPRCLVPFTEILTGGVLLEVGLAKSEVQSA